MVRKVLVLGALLLLPMGGWAQERPEVPYRVWQFHEMDLDYLARTLPLAARYDVNTVVFSHGMIWNAMDLYGTSGHRLNSPFEGAEHGRKLQELAQQAQDHGLRVWIWTHEVADVPGRFLEDDRVQLDAPGFWDWLRTRYEQVFTDFPEFDGLLLTFHETQYKVFDDEEVASALSKPERFAKLINTIHEAAEGHGKDLVVRTHAYEPEEMAWLEEGLKGTDERVMIQSKVVPHDWQPYYPNNPLIGSFPGRRHIVEFDVSSEYTGRNRVPYASPSYFARRWRRALEHPEVVGYNARLDHGGYDALATPNEINAYTLHRVTERPALPDSLIWAEWTALRYGREAAPYVERALRPSFEIVNRAFFPLEFWITNHSRLPSFNYAEGHISSRTNAKWWPDKPHYAEVEERLNHPDPLLLEEVLAEKDTALALADEALLHLEEARPLLGPAEYEDLYRRLNLLRRVALVWKYHAEAFFGYKVLAEGYDVPGLEARVRRAVAALHRQAEVSRQDPYVGDAPPAGAREIQQVADELLAKLNALTGSFTY